MHDRSVTKDPMVAPELGLLVIACISDEIRGVVIAVLILGLMWKGDRRRNVGKLLNGSGESLCRCASSP